MKKNISFYLLLALSMSALAQVAPITHPAIGTKAYSADSTFCIELIGKKQYYAPTETATADKDINSPKSVNMHPNGTKYYVNSLEGATTVVYDFKTNQKLKVIRHEFTEADTVLLMGAKPYYEFTHHLPDAKHPVSGFGGWGAFYGKPVESAFTHGGRYLWIPYYRRSYDLNAQDPSAVAIIDTETDSIIRLMDTGPLPKMIACSHDGRHIAVSHWGDNTVGIISTDGDDPTKWTYEKLHVIDYQLKLNYSLTAEVNRDVNSGYTLRGTVFTPDDHYLLVGCMGGGGGIAVIDMQQKQYLGRVLGMRSNIRHLIIKDGWLYLSSNAAGVIQRMRLDTFLEAAGRMTNHTATARGWEECAVMGGARTIEASPSGRFLFAACNTGSRLCAVDTRQMKMVASIACDSYPVGLDISADGQYVIVTSQGRKHAGGNAVNIYQVRYAEPEQLPASEREAATAVVESDDSIHAHDEAPVDAATDDEGIPPLLLFGGIGLAVLVAGIVWWKLKGSEREVKGK